MTDVLRMHVRLAVVLVAAVVATGCQTVTVHVPPEVDLAGIKTVAVDAVDLLIDPAPVAILLRVDTASRIRRLLPALMILDRADQADAVVRLEVARHGVGPVQVRTSINASTGETSCTAWQDAFLTVAASITSGSPRVQRWQAPLDAGRRIELGCVPSRIPVGIVRTTAVADRDLVTQIVDELARRLAGYTRTELQPRPTPPPATP